MKFIEITNAYPKASKLLEKEDFLRYPCLIARELGLEPEIWTLKRKGFPKEEIVNGIRVKRFHNSYSLFFSLFNKDIKLIHSFLRPCKPSLLAGLVNKPKIFTTVSYEIGSTKLIKIISLFLLKRFDKVICLTPYELEIYKQNGIEPDKLLLLPFAIDYNFFSKRIKHKEDIMKRYGINSNDFKVITIANFRSCKNLDTMVKAFQIFNRKIPNSTFIVIGQDRLKDKETYKEQPPKNKSILELIKSNKKIVWLGERSPHEIRELLNISDVYVLSSSIEAQGLTNYEAAATGKAICLSNIGSFTTVFKDYVLYHPPKDAKRLSENFYLYYKNKKLREANGRKVKELVKGWDYKIIKRKLKSLYEELLKK